MRKRSWAVGASLLAGAVGLAGAEPPNLDLRKDEIRAYVSTGAYEREIAAVAAEARAWIQEREGRRRPGERLAVVFDLDETLISNLPFMLEHDLGGSDAAWEAWLAAGKDPAIEPVRELYRFVRQRGVEAIFITGRRERLRTATEANLRAVGCGDFAVLTMAPNDWKRPTSAFKTAERARLASEGFGIVANLGDQESDLAGGHAERTFKLPNPFYFTK